jgi:hypothetical protein
VDENKRYSSWKIVNHHSHQKSQHHPRFVKYGEEKPRVTRTIGDKEIQAKRLHFDTCLLQQDLLKKAKEIHTVMTGDDERAKKKIPKAMSKILTHLSNHIYHACWL